MDLATHVLRAFLCLWPVLLTLPAHAQETVPLKPAHGGAFLPEGTAVVVLQKPGVVQRDSLYQPEFLAHTAFPADDALLLRRDTLDARGRTRITFPRTQPSGQVYFVYAHTPDSTLYWSYSAQRDSLKFDVVDRGVMSVAPVADAAAREAIRAAFFDAAAEEDRVVVYMPEQPAAPDSAAARAADTLAASTAADTLPAPALEQASPPEAVPPRKAAALPPASPRGVLLPYGLFYSLLAFVLFLLAIPAYLAFTYHRDLVEHRKEIFHLRTQQMPHPIHPDRQHEMARALEEAEHRRRQAERSYEVLKARYVALLHDLDPEADHGGTVEETPAR